MSILDAQVFDETMSPDQIEASDRRAGEPFREIGESGRILDGLSVVALVLASGAVVLLSDEPDSIGAAGFPHLRRRHRPGRSGGNVDSNRSRGASDVGVIHMGVPL